MKSAVVPSQYLQIALDLAQRIAKGQLPEGSRIYGRSVMASEYGVSPETIRRALRLLSDMKVVEVKPQSGAVVLSADSARRYIANFDEGADVQSLRQRLRDLMEESAEVNRRMAETVSALVKSQETFAAADQPEHRRAEILAGHRRYHCRHPPGPDRDPLPRPLRRTVQRRHHHFSGQPRCRGGRSPIYHGNGVKEAL